MTRLKVLEDTPLPPLYAAWLRELLGGPIPSETRAACDACPMCATGHGEEDREPAFDPRVKCCTFLPDLPNFLVGRVLLDQGRAAAAGRRSVEARIDAKIAATPLGLGAPAPYAAMYRDAMRHSEFGRAPTLRCPHFLESSGHCGVWRHRMSTCATWFCKHARGAVGMDFWRTGVQPLLLVAESALARYCVLTLDPGPDALLRLFARRGQDDGPRHAGAQIREDPEVQRLDWGSWLGRERELYVECARIVGELRWREVLPLGGVELQARARIAQALYERLVDESLPKALRPGPFQVLEVGRDHTRLTSYSSYDPVEIPTALLPLLGRFDGRPTREVLAELRGSEGAAEIDAPMLRRLVDFEILLADTERGGPP